ncbi:cobalamin 5'-phosphate synthase cobs [Heliomicrobium modesticaldum Ice1]|uniref:Adenosylcobinamide-GDP ribazoletransferase n=1 Tax=Heliobacterium modesticaldum (strain ATCC 51547 / Ice1) TaxID=498761 RepID=B0TIL1_HELMI|nr:adenosylcobinamide-GDP ribazoletransferase [Heliomicrobium modesticaldum]ABZ84952.1 cobalamin 5'-phosphate synthase cobs [Heliomicrobium modesticaldum Ice1]
MLVRPWLRFRLALSFFTRLPVGALGESGDEDFGRSFVYLPLVGLLLGLLLSGASLIISVLFPPIILPPLLLALHLYLTGGIHLDGFMDTFDGIFSARKPERVLEIMRDSRVGAHSVLAVTVLLMTKAAAIYALWEWGHLPDQWQVSGLNQIFDWRPTWKVISGLYGQGVSPLWITLLWMPMAGRWVVVYMVSGFPYARSQGMASLFNRYIDRSVLAAGTLFVAAVAGLVAGLAGWVFLALLWLFFRWWGGKLTRFLGGLTGDIYGAGCEIGEVLLLLTAVLLLRFL